MPEDVPRYTPAVTLNGEPIVSTDDTAPTEHIRFTHDEVVVSLRGEEAFQAMFGGLPLEQQEDMRQKIKGAEKRDHSSPA